MDENKLVRYSMQLVLLKQLRKCKLISDVEYNKIYQKLKKDYNMVSDKYA